MNVPSLPLHITPELFSIKMIEVTNLVKYQDTRIIINDISFSASERECIGLFGEDATVKTELLRLMSGSTLPTSGHISIQGFNTQTHPFKARKSVGCQLEQDLGHPRMSVKEFLYFIAAVRGIHGAEKRTRVDQTVARLALTPVLNAPLDTLTASFKRKVAIAQAILHGPALLLLNEPTKGFTADEKQDFKALMKALTHEMTVIIASRFYDELSEFCTRALVIAGGRLVADTSLPDLQRDSRHYQAVTLCADAPLDLLALAVLPGVAGIEEHRYDPGTVTVLATPGHKIYSHINALIAARCWKINSMYLEPGRLNEVVDHLSRETLA